MRKYVAVPGDKIYELPPLLVGADRGAEDEEKVVSMAERMIDAEGIIVAEDAFCQRRFDLAIKLAERYFALTRRWRWGCDVLEWICQCETTFKSQPELRDLLSGDVWPHPGRRRFVELLKDKRGGTREIFPGIDVEAAVGSRLIFKELPFIECFSEQTLFYLDLKLVDAAYGTWSHLPPPVDNLPPERFTFQIIYTEADA